VPPPTGPPTSVTVGPVWVDIARRCAQVGDDGSVTSDRDRLRVTFDCAAQLYHQARPDYPAAVYDELVRLADLRAGDRVLDIGCAPGKATIPLARRGYRITCVEIGPELAAAARRNLAGFGGVEVIEAAFETWRPPGAVAFDLVFAATAWHWIDPAVKYRRAWLLLRPGGHLAFWSAAHVFPPGGDRFFRDIQDVYDEIGEGLPAGASWPRPGELADDTAEIEGSGLFEGIRVRQFDWEVRYSADEYIRLLDTFSGHLAMEEWKRDRLYAEFRRRLAERPDGRLRRHWGAVLHVARRRAISVPLARATSGQLGSPADSRTTRSKPITALY
jgi:SAM-dependent methyltransferase